MQFTYKYTEQDLTRLMSMVDRIAGRRIFHVAFAVCGLIFLAMGSGIVTEAENRIDGILFLAVGAAALLQSVRILILSGKLRARIRANDPRLTETGWEIDERGITILPVDIHFEWSSFRRAYFSTDDFIMTGSKVIWIPIVAFPAPDALQALKDMIKKNGIKIKDLA